MTIKTLSVFGTRPEAIKMAPLVNFLAQDKRFSSTVAVTAQHREMLDQVLALFEITPAYDLNIMQHRQTLFDITSGALIGLDEVYKQEKPDIILVHGDTTTTFAASLAAFYNQIPVGHVEAGLRTYNKFSPYPEEINRKLTGVLADYHFAPTKTAKENLLTENVSTDKIVVTGNTVIDALLATLDKPYEFTDKKLTDIDFIHKKVLLVTCHRRENLGEPMRQIFRALRRLVEKYPEVEIIFPVHKNPVVRELSTEILGRVPGIHLIEPLDYQPFVNLMAKSYLILTDSGGMQEEAPSLGKPVLVLRETTERPEALEAGTVKLIGTKEQDVFSESEKLIIDVDAYKKMANAVNPYGDGKASARIADALALYLQQSK